MRLSALFEEFCRYLRSRRRRPLAAVDYWWCFGDFVAFAMQDVGGTVLHRVWKIIKALGRRAGLSELHRMRSGACRRIELHRRTGGDLRGRRAPAARGHQTTTVYTRVTQHELQQVVSVFDKPGS